MINLFTRLFPLWAILLSTIAYYKPAHFTDLKTGIVPLLTVIMFGMGMTLTVADFKTVLHRKKALLVGLLLQYGVMPLAAFVIARILGLPQALLVGMVLVGSTAGGTASNVICYLAKADVALSISMTLLSTLLAAVAMPALTWVYVGQMVPVPVLDMFLSVLKIVLLPVLAGVTINGFLGNKLAPLKAFFPLVSVFAIVLVIAIIVALNQAKIADSGVTVLLAVIAHNTTGLIAGLAVARLLHFDVRTTRTLAIEVGMQNSGLSVALAIKYFPASAAIPGAIFSIWHNISGSVLASYWSRAREDEALRD